ncbi:hypothetical protein [Demequina salsinemoris]|uniref:hypothetical protein n=1 Tax=Demequina salsinemoris TaxID=577470 RepID=UPI0007864554|nr:hypothetical protein [Demequina salsinemoris]
MSGDEGDESAGLEPDQAEPEGESAPTMPTRSELRATSALAKAWWSLALIPVAGVVAFLVGEGIPALLGYDVVATEAPWWVMVLALLGAAVVMCLPLLVTRRLTRRASGQPGSRTPLVVGTVIVGAFLVLNIVSGAIVLLFD